MDKKREEQICMYSSSFVKACYLPFLIVSVLNGHGVSPKQLKQAILDADTSVLTPGLLSAVASILPTKKEAALCLEHRNEADTAAPSDMSDKELAQLFLVEAASIPRVTHRVEAMIARSDFELKAAVIHKVPPFRIFCSSILCHHSIHFGYFYIVFFLFWPYLHTLTRSVMFTCSSAHFTLLCRW